MRNELVKDIRHYKNMTQEQFAQWLGVHYSTIAVTESNHRKVSDNLAAKIARKFDVTSDGFIAYLERKRKADDYFFNADN